jgi:hypothetical protein
LRTIGAGEIASQPKNDPNILLVMALAQRIIWPYAMCDLLFISSVLSGMCKRLVWIELAQGLKINRCTVLMRQFKGVWIPVQIELTSIRAFH